MRRGVATRPLTSLPVQLFVARLEIKKSKTTPCKVSQCAQARPLHQQSKGRTSADARIDAGGAEDNRAYQANPIVDPPLGEPLSPKDAIFCAGRRCPLPIVSCNWVRFAKAAGATISTSLAFVACASVHRHLQHLCSASAKLRLVVQFPVPRLCA